MLYSPSSSVPQSESGCHCQCHSIVMGCGASSSHPRNQPATPTTPSSSSVHRQKQIKDQPTDRRPKQESARRRAISDRQRSPAASVRQLFSSCRWPLASRSPNSHQNWNCSKKLPHFPFFASAPFYSYYIFRSWVSPILF